MAKEISETEEMPNFHRSAACYIPVGYCGFKSMYFLSARLAATVKRLPSPPAEEACLFNE